MGRGYLGVLSEAMHEHEDLNDINHVDVWRKSFLEREYQVSAKALRWVLT